MSTLLYNLVRFLASFARRRFRLALAALSFGLMVLMAACGTRNEPQEAKTATNAAALGAGTTLTRIAYDVRDKQRVLSDEEAQDYLGNAVCAACHADAAATHGRSHHAHTFRAVSLEADGKRFRTSQTVVDAHLKYVYKLSEENNQCTLIGSNAKGTGRMPAQYALGSGHNGITYVSQTEPDQWLELRLSYFPRAKTWDFTPGQEQGEDLPRAAGAPHPFNVISQCFLCHGTAVRATGEHVDLEKSLMNVGCERCHGPGKAHVAQATQAGASTPQALAQAKSTRQAFGMEDLARATPERIMTICGACHLADKPDKPLAGPQLENLARFQGASLRRSACYQKSGALSCITCHDSHSNADPSLARNDAICLRCHSEKGSGFRVEDAGSAPKETEKICPVNPQTDCTRCHMPRQTVPAMPHSEFTNHWIKSWKESKQE